MAMIIGASITDVTEVDSQQNFIEKEHSIDNNDSDISKVISKCNNKEEIRNRENEENIEENINNICDTISSNNNIDYNNEKLQIKETSNLTDNDDVVNGIDLNERGENKLRVNDICINENNDNINEEKLSRRFLDLVDSDSEEETNNYKTLNDKFVITNVKHLSESSEHLQIAKHKKNSKNRSLRRIDSESEDDLQTSNADDFPHTIQETAKNYTIDSTSEEEEETIHKSVDASDSANISESIKDIKEKSIKKRKGSIRASKNEAMRQIHSESQRLLRETKVSLPYHRPKQRTLQEFLNRKKITILPKAPSMAAKVKMSSAIVSQMVAEREKEAELFYNSSDSENEIQQFINKDLTEDIKNSCIENEKISSIESIELSSNIQDCEKIENNHDSCIEKKITQQNQLDVNEIFKKDFCEINHQDKAYLELRLSPLIENNSTRDDESNMLPQTSIESNQDLQRSSVSRKLFDSNCENTTSKIDIRHNKQETIGQITETSITALDAEKYINEEKQDNKVHDDKETDEKLQRKDCMTNNVTLTASNDCIIQNENKKQDDCVEIDDTSQSCILMSDTPSKSQIDISTEKYETSDSHVLGLPLPTFINDTVTDRNKLLPKFIPNQKVTLKGLPGTIIDLTYDPKPNKKGINALLDRFFNKHIDIKKQTEDKSEISVIHLQDTENGPVPVKQVFPYKLSTNIDNPELNKPGAKLKRLKEDLKLQMTLKRNEQWKQKKMEQRAEEKEEWDEEEENDYDLDKREKISNLELSDSEESEPEENDVCLKDRKRKKYLFADDEAEVTDGEDSNISIEETDNESDIDQVERSNKKSANIKRRKEHMDNASEIETDQEEYEDLDAGMQDENESDSQDTNICKNIVKNKKNRKTKQLMQEFQNVSDIDSNDLENKSNQIKNIMTDIDIFKKYSEDNDSVSENEYNIPVYQQNTEVYTKSQICKTPLVKTSMLDFISPVTQLSVLNVTSDSNKKDSSEKNEYLDDKYESSFMESTQNDESFEYMSGRNKTISKKRLFDIGETIDDEYLMKLCSGKFESTQSTNLNIKVPSQFDITDESQLPELCSRNLKTKSTDPKQSKNREIDEVDEEVDEGSQNMKLTFHSEDSEDFNKFVNYTEKEKEVNMTDSKLKLMVASSDDDQSDDDQSDDDNYQSDDADTFFKPKRRSMKKLILSDSEEEKEEEDAQSDEENADNAENTEQYVDYDSEENEVIVKPEKDIRNVAADFLEEEAELSESDWDSADEDEKDLDKLEFEEGDDEHIDENKVKDELGKIHMKQILDEDKREVRLLKELLFEDGDLHTDGTGRERKFRWRNIDKLEDNSQVQISENDGWVDVQEDEEEAKWSKFRRERDKFLEERKKCSNNDIEDDLHDSKIFKLGLKALKRIENNKSKEQEVFSNKIDPSENMEPIMPQSITDLLDGPITGKKSQTLHNVMKKRSFLTRGEESLARLASLAKQGDSISHMVNTRNFVFQYIDPCTNNVSKEERKTREENDQELQNKSHKRKNTSDFSSTIKKRRK